MTRDEEATTSEEAVRQLVEALREDLVRAGHPIGWLHSPADGARERRRWHRVVYGAPPLGTLRRWRDDLRWFLRRG